jgi:hypothetical protein
VLDADDRLLLRERRRDSNPATLTLAEVKKDIQMVWKGVVPSGSGESPPGAMISLR